VAERHWNAQVELIRKSHPDHARLNNYLLASAAGAQRILADMLADKAPITAQVIKQRMKVQLGGIILWTVFAYLGHS
jgi:hypothetical protein